MADDDGPGPGGGGEKKIAGIPRSYVIAGGVALVAGLAWMWWERTHGAKSSSTSTTVITGSVSSNTGISGSMLNAILKDWQEHPQSASTSTSTGGGSGGTGGSSSGGSTKTSTKTGTSTKTSTKTSAPPPVKAGAPPPKAPAKTTAPAPAKKITSYKSVTVKAGQTLDEIAKQYGITPAQLASQNVYVSGEVPGNKKVGQTLGTGAGLKTGQVLRIPVYS